jgi:hypothetical protein
MKEKLQLRKEKSAEENKDRYSIEECVKIVESMGDIEDDTFIKMMDKLTVIEWRKLFVTMSEARRRAWLSSL